MFEKFFETINDKDFKDNYKQAENFFRKGRDTYLTSKSADEVRRTATDATQQATTPYARMSLSEMATPTNLAFAGAGIVALILLMKGK